MQRKLARDFIVATVLAASLSVASAFARAAVPAATPAAPRFFSTANGSTQTPCFLRRNWSGRWKASPDARSIYIRVSRSVYRLDFDSSYSLLKDPFAVLSNSDSANSICTPLDFRLTVSNRAGIIQTPIVKHMTRLSPAEAAALPKSLKP